jgi:hypothetical protein
LVAHLLGSFVKIVPVTFALAHISDIPT